MATSPSTAAKAERRRQVRRRVRAAHQHRPRSARRHAALQAALDRRGGLPHGQAPARHPADLPQARRDHPRPRVLLLSSPSCSRASWSTASPRSAENGSWSEIRADLDALTETEIVQDGKRFLLRSAPAPLPASPSVPPASPCRRPFRPSPPTDCRSGTVVPRRGRGANCRSRSVT